MKQKDAIQVATIMERYLAGGGDALDTFPAVLLSRGEPLETTIRGYVNVSGSGLQMAAPALRVWLMERANELQEELRAAGWYCQGTGPRIEFSSSMRGGLHLLDGRMVREPGESYVCCTVEMTLRWSELVPELQRIPAD